MKKNAKIIYRFVIVFFVIASCCKKNNSTPNLLKGKIKRIQETLVVPNKNYYYDLHFFYDSINGELQKITLGNKVYIEISKKTSNYFILDYDISVRDSTTTPNHIKIKAYLNNDGYINKLEYVDSALVSLQELMNIYTSNGYPDSVREFVGESIHYGYQFLDGNMVQSTHFYNVFFSGDNTFTYKYFYSNKINNNSLPSQYSNMYFYAAPYSTIATKPLYLLGLNGYFPYKNNKNLIDSIGFIGSNSVTRFEYTTNSSDQISRMKWYNSVTRNSTFDIEYY